MRIGGSARGIVRCGPKLSTGAIGRPIRLRIAHRDTRALRPDGYAGPTVSGHHAQDDLDGHGLPSDRHGALSLWGSPDGLGDARPFGEHSIGEDVAMLAVAFAGGALGCLDLSWCAVPESARLEWALNDTVAKERPASLRLMTDGSLDWTSPDRQSRTQAGRLASGRPGLPGRLHRDPAALHRGLDLGRRARDPARQTTSKRWKSSGRPTARPRKDAR